MSWLSICVPTYNRKCLLEELVASILAQNDLNVELVIVDDGSTDGTQKYIEELQKNSPIKIKYEWQNNSGKAAALGGPFLFLHLILLSSWTLMMYSKKTHLKLSRRAWLR